jgi:cytochrome c oxidase cbb3-type subunit IV
MDINLMRSIVTVLSFVLFIALVVWTWNKSRRTAFEEAAALPFADDTGAQQAAAGEKQ